MNLKIALGLPAVLALGLTLAACDNNNNQPAPTAQTPAADAAPAADATAEAEKKAAEEAAAAEAAAAEKAAAAAKAEEEKKAAEAAAAAKAAEEKKAAEAAAKAAEEKKAAEAAAAAKAAEEKKAAEAAAASGNAAQRGASDAAAAVTDAGAAPTAGKLPSTGLKPDTLVAVKSSNPELPYLGVWASDAAACATVDQAGATGYVVITKISIRQGATLALADATPLAGGKAKLGDAEVSMPTPDSLQVGAGTPLVRCTQ